MNWFKKQMNKLFDNDIDEEEYYEDEEFEEFEEQISLNFHEDGQINEGYQNKRKSFKFPIIADNEVELPPGDAQTVYPESQNQLSNRFDETKRDSKYFYQPNAISKVYDVEVSGIRDLLEKRQRIKGHSNVFNHKESTLIRRVEKVKKAEPTNKEFKRTTPIKKTINEQDDPLIPKRKFTPTQVPSPVYGFKKPSNIDQLLSKKQERVGLNSKVSEDDAEEKHTISEIAHLQHEEKIDLMLSESARVKEEIASSVETITGIDNQKLNNTAPVIETSTTNFIEIEDELEEKPIVLTDELYEKVEDFPILAESFEETATAKHENVEAPQPVHANLRGHAGVEAAVTVYDPEPSITPMSEGEKGLPWGQIGENSSNKLDLMNQQNTTVLEAEIETEPFTEERDLEEEEGYVNKGDFIEKLLVSQVISNDEEPSDPYLETESAEESYLEPIQSAQVQRLVSIALNDSELEEETENQTAHGHDRFETIDQSNEGQALGVTETYESQILEIKSPVSENEENMSAEKQSKGSKLPFNVLMLKSDKEKYAARLAQKQMLQHNDDIKEIHGHITKTVEEPVIEQGHGTSQFGAAATAVQHNVTTQQQQTTMLREEKDWEDETLPIQEEETVPLQEKVAEMPEEVAATNLGVKSLPKIYIKPSFDFLSPPEEKTEDREWLESQGDVLVESLSYFQVTAQVESITQGPAVTQFEITVGHGTKVSKVRNLSDDLKLALAAKDIRIQAPIPGKSTIGIEIPNRISRAVQLSEVTSSDSFLQSDSPLEAALGLDLTGKPVTIDLRKMPHGLIAGATGSGKSVCINSILISLLYKADPNELKLMLIDPKMVELAPFNHIPHLVSPVITDVKAATAALKWAVEEMERRYQLFAHVGVRDLPRYNKLADSKGEHGHKLPYILIVIDELADLMMMSPADVEEAICRIAQKARACGIHLIVATQRPSVDVITGLIKSNIPTRIAFAVSSQVDSRTILDSQGAERLLGRGDMLYLGNGMSAPIRLQGTFVTDDEIQEIIDYVRAQGEPDYFFQQDELLKKTEMVEEQDELFEEVCRFVHEQGSASTSSIQRKYHIGYNRAARLIDMLESQGFISEPRGSKPREVYLTDSDLSTMFE
ncbi:DNA translocase FtsK [Ureibacillus aquaedulcis]|uniref:DNA translocase FtsK n=1 Tax=Ureibacillus aquaedulcis TaxID=3058421 RepID=A0ABT8GQN1_9BACL|nr:DNA translocase FtsK [Ureibacillus sp. BA0131]MDN4493713.1 DNA translocase FtsK [Ureibacillus sp. BA0131]